MQAQLDDVETNDAQTARASDARTHGHLGLALRPLLLDE
jgi:hypothetical protein